MVVRIKARLAVATLCSVLTLAALFSLISQNAAAEIGPKNVNGYVRDSGGHLLTGADVAVTVYNRTTHLPTGPTLTMTSDEDGFYFVDVDPANWGIGDTITVVATFESNQVSNSTLADPEPVQEVNLQFPLGIAQFGSLIGLGISAGLVGVVALVFLKKRH